MPSIDEQKMGVLLAVKARKLAIASIFIMLLFSWTIIGGVIAIICLILGFRNAKAAKMLAPDSPVVQSAYTINNILRWLYIIPSIFSLIGLVIYGVLLLFGIVSL